MHLVKLSSSEPLVTIIFSFTTEMTRFASDPTPIYLLGARVAEAIESLSTAK